MSSQSPNSSDAIVAYCDGGSRGNPGPAGFGVYIQDSTGEVLAELSQYLGKQTNNFAEYSALLAALEFAIAQGHRSLRVVSDSELMVKQMKGQYRVNSPELRPLYEEARRRVPQLEHFQIQHVLREKNRHADRLANLAMDRGMGRAPAANPAPAPAPPSPSKAVMLRGLVKGGVVHVLGGELPDGIFVKVIPE
ncbi:MAG: ribonuclease HI family protein [Acidobacteriaceae bacterium]|jgi:ribonuclease HI